MATFINLIERFAMVLGVLCVAAMMFVVSFDAFSRYAFRAPVPWAFEVVSYFLLSASVFFAGSATYRHGDHINLDLFRAYFRPSIRARIDAVWGLMTAVVFGLLTYGAALETMKGLRNGTFIYGYVLWPGWIPYAILVLGCVIVTLRLTYHSFQLLLVGEAAEYNTPEEHTA